MTHESIIRLLGLCVAAAPAVLVAALGVPALLSVRLSERTIGRWVYGTVVTGLLASLAILAIMLIGGSRHVPITVGSWVHIPEYHFAVKFVFDRLSVPFVILTFVLCGTVGAFANRYMHREPGFSRFFLFFAIFMCGMVTTSLAGTVETLFAGWELVGLSSAFLVAFYHERPAPVRNGLRVWCVYRISDAALLVASVLMHHLTGEGDFDKLTGAGDWPEGVALISDSHAISVGLLMLLAAAGKSALVPFSGWLPRAMEGPTPSSAVFYGALSVHLGAFLLLRISPVLECSLWLSAAVIAAGLTTAVFAALAERVQTDIKGALSFASLTQVGIIVAEIGFGLRYIALIHILGHGCLRTLQFLRAPSLLHDYRIMENAIGDHLPHADGGLKRRVSDRIQLWFYRLAMERGYLDAALFDFVVGPFLRLLRRCDAAERRWVRFLNGESRTESSPDHSPGTFEELL